MDTDASSETVEVVNSPPPRKFSERDEQALIRQKMQERMKKQKRLVRLVFRWIGFPLLVFLIIQFFLVAPRKSIDFLWLFLIILALYLIGRLLQLIIFWIFLFPFLAWRAMRMINEANQRRNSGLVSLGLNIEDIYFWEKSRFNWPSFLALDVKRRLLYINLAERDYEDLVIGANEIRDVKVERESEVHTTTTHKGGFSFALFGSGVGAGYHADGKSHSKSVEVERAFLEIYYQRACDAAPRWVAIPFGEDRRKADSMAIAIRQL
ncbi:hypothetical protein [Allofranklinella schreckenbergeri]|nr:hypothetical protein [Allofranklinella schreckenbergeri]